MNTSRPFADLTTANIAAAAWCAEVDGTVHAETCAVPAVRLGIERPLLRPLPALRLEIGWRPITRKVDKLSCIRFGSARYSVPCRLIGRQVTLTTGRDRLSVVEPVTVRCSLEHRLVPPGADQPGC